MTAREQAIPTDAIRADLPDAGARLLGPTLLLTSP